MAQTLLDPKQFSLANMEFLKKLNSLKKSIKNGRWTILQDLKPKPVATPTPQETINAKTREQQDSAKAKLLALDSEVKFFQMQLDRAKAGGDDEKINIRMFIGIVLRQRARKGQSFHKGKTKKNTGRFGRMRHFFPGPHVSFPPAFGQLGVILQGIKIVEPVYQSLQNQLLQLLPDDAGWFFRLRKEADLPAGKRVAEEIEITQCT
ncbi:MAG TPA: hypothetical protein PLS65_11340, partial [Ferruginibacter sp.]|nr:hypothetical protein [Ferruginibacter sp.]